MRGDLGLQLRLTLRTRGVLGVVIVVAACATATAVYLPWYEVVVHVEALGYADAGAVTSVPGWHAQPWIWLVAAFAGLGGVLGILLVVDRPPSWTREGLLAVAIGIALVTGLSALAHPPDERFLADERLRRLQAATAELPDDVAVDLSVRPAIGTWVSLASSALLLTTAFAMREV